MCDVSAIWPGDRFDSLSGDFVREEGSLATVFSSDWRKRTRNARTPHAPEFHDVLQLTMEADMPHSRARIVGMRALDPKAVRVWRRRSFEAFAPGCSVPEESNRSGVLVTGVPVRPVVPTDSPFSVK